MNTRVTRLNEVQYADSECRLQQLVAEGFVADEQRQKKQSRSKKSRKRQRQRRLKP